MISFLTRVEVLVDTAKSHSPFLHFTHLSADSKGFFYPSLISLFKYQRKATVTVPLKAEFTTWV